MTTLQVNEFFMQEKILFKFLQKLPYLKHIFNENNILFCIYESSIKTVKVAKLLVSLEFSKTFHFPFPTENMHLYHVYIFMSWFKILYLICGLSEELESPVIRKC